MDPSKKRWVSRLGIVVIAALLVEVISILQYQRLKAVMQEEMDVRSRVVLGSMGAEIGHMMELTETTMKENLWKVKRDLQQPDSSYSSLIYMIDDNPHVVGGCLAFVPDYYPSKGRLFEPYARKNGGSIQLTQIAGPDHDYTQNAFFQRALETGRPFWSDPYTYESETSDDLITYTAPIWDTEGISFVGVLSSCARNDANFTR